MRAATRTAHGKLWRKQTRDRRRFEPIPAAGEHFGHSQSARGVNEAVVRQADEYGDEGQHCDDLTGPAQQNLYHERTPTRQNTISRNSTLRKREHVQVETNGRKRTTRKLGLKTENCGLMAPSIRNPKDT